MTLTTYNDRDSLAIDVAQVLADDLRQALHHADRVLFAVPGGSTPGPIFDALCAADIDWERVDVMLTDERWVPEDHDRSNARLVKERLLTARAAAARFLPFYAPAHTPDEVLAEVEAMLAPEMPISVLLLGMGPDMHTASMFPGADGLEQALAPDAPILVPISHADLPDTRVTLSAAALNGALRKHVVITGSDKRAAIAAARHLDPKDAPIRAVLDGATIHWAD